MLLFGMVLSFLIPFGIWSALRSWKPQTRKSYAAKFSLWSFIIFSHYLGYPIARAIFGVESSSLPGLDHAIPGVILAVAFITFIAWFDDNIVKTLGFISIK